MYSTFKMMNAVEYPEFKDTTLERLCIMYDSEKNPVRRNKIIKTMYCKMFPMMFQIQEKYTQLSQEQKAEVTMFILLDSLKLFAKSGKTKAKFSTYYYNNLENGMKTVCNSMACMKRKVWKHMVNVEEQLLTHLIDTNQVDRSMQTEKISDEELRESIKTTNDLNTVEKQYCEAVLDGCTRAADLGDRVSTFKDDKAKLFMTSPINTYRNIVKLSENMSDLEKEHSKGLKQIKKSLQTKLPNCGVL